MQVAGAEFEVDSAQDTNNFYMANGNILDGVNKVSLAKDKIFIRFFSCEFLAFYYTCTLCFPAANS